MWKIREALGVAALVVGLLVVGLAACGGPPQPTCAPGAGTPFGIFTLYFGKAIAGRGELTETEWRSFLEDTVTANLAERLHGV